MSNLSWKDLLEDFGARLYNERPHHQGDLRGPQHTAGLSRFGSERRDLSPGFEGMAVEQEQQDRNVRPCVSLGGEEDPVLRGPAGPPVVYGPSISDTQCETRGSDPRRGTQELPRPASTMTTTERLLEKVALRDFINYSKLNWRSWTRGMRTRHRNNVSRTTTLPSLSAPSGNESAVALQDWLEVIDGPLRDISDSSSWWWDAVKKRACDSYRIWVASGPYERLAHKPPTVEDLRLSARTAGMLLQAMAETVRAEMVARSITRSPVALLFRLYTMYQPGGESEKAYILQYLVTPPKAQTAVEMVATLRQWERMLLRADNLSIAKPDPSLLVRGLNALVGDVWAQDRDVTFRTQLVKSRLGVDVSPTWESALQLHQHLRAEAENMVHALPTTTTTTTKPAVGDGQRDPKLRPLQPNQSQGTTNLAKASSTTPPTTSTASVTAGGAGEKKCKWFTEPQGCRRGASCKFVHSFEGISKKNRCYTCGAEGHQSSSCPTKTEGSDSGPKPKGKAKAKSAPGTPSSKEDGRPGNPAARSLTTEPEPQPTPPTSPTTTGEAASSAGTAGTGEMKEVLRDAAQALKSLMSSGSTASSSSSTLEGLQRQLDELKLKALSIKNEAVELRRARRTPLDVRVEEGVPTLIDSGATHILRQPRDGAEMASATRVSVTLANDEKRDLLQAESGAILSTSAETQPILPMAELVSAGCEISWKKGNFKVVHPVWGELRTTIRGGCPELAQEQAAKLVNEIEDKKLKELKDGVSLLKAKLEQLVHEEKLPWITYVERYLEGGLAKDLWKGLQGSFMKILSEHMLDPLCQGINLEKDGTI